MSYLLFNLVLEDLILPKKRAVFLNFLTLNKGTLCVYQHFSTLALLSFCGRHFSIVRVTLCIVRCLAVSLVSTD